MAALENRFCPGCKKSVVDETGGLVVAFGQSFFHVECFTCAKCHEQVTADTNILLLSDGSPICANCSYNCNVCHQPILDEAIMTGDDSYHAHCFNCKVCSNRIDELIFAKTTQGIYCMKCHNERMAKIRRHAQKKREREKAAGGSSSSATREHEARDFHKEKTKSSTLLYSPPRASATLREDCENAKFPDVSQIPSQQRTSLPAVNHLPEKVHKDSYKSMSIGSDANIAPRRSSSDYRPPQPFSVTVAPPDNISKHSVPRPNVGPLSRRNSQLPPGYLHGSSPDGENVQRQPATFAHTGSPEIRNADDNPRQPDLSPKNAVVSYQQQFDNGKQAGNGLNVPGGTSSRIDKRRSINPILSLNHEKTSPPASSGPSNQPIGMVRSQTVPVHIANAPSNSSPSHTQFAGSASPSGQVPINSLPLDNAPKTTALHSPSSHVPTEDERSASSSALLPETTPVPQNAQNRSPHRPEIFLQKIPARLDSLASSVDAGRLANNGASSRGRQLSPVMTPDSISGRRSISRESEHVALGEHSSANASRRSSTIPPLSSSYIPHGIENGTDMNGRQRSESEVDVRQPPVAPPKENKAKAHAGALKLDIDPNTSTIPHLDGSNSSDEASESSPVERTSIATFIAPALPPIRFSMTSNDFSDVFIGVGRSPSLRSLAGISHANEGGTRFGRGPSFDVTPIAENFPSGIRRATTPPNTPLAVHNHQEAHQQMLDVPGDSLSSKTHKTTSLSRQSSTRGRAASESYSSPYGNGIGRQWFDSNVSLDINPTGDRITVTSPESTEAKPLPNDDSDLVLRRLREALAHATERGSQQLKFDKAFVEAILAVMEQRQHEVAELRHEYDGSKRVSQKYMDGLTVAHREYDEELKARRNAEAEVIRLRVLLSGQAAKITALSGEAKKQETRQQISRQLSNNLNRLESDLSKLKVERDVTLAEVEELCASKSTGEVPTVQLSRSLTMRLDNIKTQYQHDLVPLTQQREALGREITELKAARDQFLEETTVLNARNEELAQLNAQYARRVEANRSPNTEGNESREGQVLLGKKSISSDHNQPQPGLSPTLPSFTISTESTSTTLIEESEAKFVKVQRLDTSEVTPCSKPRPFIKWPGSKGRDPASGFQEKGKGRLEHVFHQASVLRFTRCDHCGDKLWGSQLRCTGCHISIHARCMNHVQATCTQQRQPPDELTQITPPPPSLFGRDLTEQVKADSKWGERQVPIIVEKCIDAVDALALDYEGIYRKTGGSGQSKAITQLFERGDYSAFDLRDSDRFNDICSVTSVVKTYFRSLPVPLLTFDFHEEFIMATTIKDPAIKNKAFQEVVSKLPVEHRQTLRLLMLHLHRVRERSDKNLMHARNLGVVFGPTLMWSRDPGSEFTDMAGKALSVEWLIDNAPSIFQTTT